MDDDCCRILEDMDLPNVRLISLAELEKQFAELLEAKKNRKLIEYYFTCTPALPLYILDNEPTVDSVTYLDADLFFFADPAPVYREIGEHSIAIIEHRFPDEIKGLAEYGIYNVGFLFFRRDEIGLACLRRWFAQCLEWCYDRVEGKRFADQKYLDDWPNRFENLIVLQNKGANLAPWNLSKYAVTSRAKQIRIDRQPLIFFHFHDLKRFSNWLYEPNLEKYKVNMSRSVLNRIYKPYIRTLSKIARMYPGLDGSFLREGIRIQTQDGLPAVQSPARPALKKIMNALSWRTELCRQVYQGKYILFFSGPSMGNGYLEGESASNDEA